MGLTGQVVLTIVHLTARLPLSPQQLSTMFPFSLSQSSTSACQTRGLPSSPFDSFCIFPLIPPPEVMETGSSGL